MANLPSDQLNQARNLLKDARSVLIAIGDRPNLDSVASSLSLYLALNASGKQTTIVSSQQMTVEFSHLVGVDAVSNKINSESGRNLIISFPYQEGSIEKVSYNIENETFNLVIEPREGYPIVTEEMMRFSYGGGNTDLIITLSTPRLDQLSDLYNSNQSLFREKPIINIDIQPNNVRYGRINLIDPSVSSHSELMVTLLSNLGLALDADISSNLMAGITFGSQNFTSPSTSASTFEAAAICLKNGAQRAQITPKKPAPQAVTSFQPPKKSVQIPQESAHPETPPDWLKPKIYKGSTLL